jgi:RNA polymerase sigma factor (TIGR02999 family)
MSVLFRFFTAGGGGDPQSADDLLPLVYDQLRKLAAAKMAREAPGQTLQPTALVHEAWLRLTGSHGQKWDGCDHFFAAAAEAMRRILVERARRKKSRRHGSGARRVDLQSLDLATDENDEAVLAVSELLDQLAERDPAGAKLIKLRFFVGLSNAEAARALAIPERTAKRHWAYARAWLFRELTRNP